MKNGKSSARRKRPLASAQADEWDDLVWKIWQASDRFNGRAIRLTYRKAEHEGHEGYRLILVRSHPTELAQEVEVEMEPWEDEDLYLREWTFRNLAARALRLDRRTFSANVWPEVAEFIVDTLPWYQEDIDLFASSSLVNPDERQQYLKSITFRLVDELVLACLQLDFKEITGGLAPEPPRIYVPGLAATRISRHHSQEELADLVGCTRESISNWENGGPISPRYFKWLYTALKCYPQDLRRKPSPTTDNSPE